MQVVGCDLVEAKAAVSDGLHTLKVGKGDGDVNRVDVKLLQFEVEVPPVFILDDQRVTRFVYFVFRSFPIRATQVYSVTVALAYGGIEGAAEVDGVKVAQVCIDYAGVRRFTIAALQSIAGHDPRVAVGITVVHIVSDEHGELFIHDKRVVEGNVQRNVELLVAEDGVFSKTYLRIESEDGILLGHSISHHFSVLDRLRAGASPGPVSFFHHNMLTLVTAE